jgi:hypothetical protein
MLLRPALYIGAGGGCWVAGLGGGGLRTRSGHAPDRQLVELGGREDRRLGERHGVAVAGWPA